MPDGGNQGTVPNFAADPTFLVGRKKSSGLFETFRVDIHQDTFDAFRDPCLDAWARCDGGGFARPYQPYGDLEADEYFVLPIGDLPERKQGRRPAPGQADTRPSEAASLVRMVADAVDHKVLTAAALPEVNLNFYAICFRSVDDTATIGFVRQCSPHKALRAGHRYFVFGQKLKRLAEPDLVIDPSIDIVVTVDELKVLRRQAVDSLLLDVKMVFAEVPKNAASLRAHLAGLNVTDDAIAAVQSLCGRNTRGAKRLFEWSSGPGSAAPNARRLRSALREHGLDRLLSTGVLDFDESDVHDVLDCLSDRLYAGSITGELRRADRYSSR